MPSSSEVLCSDPRFLWPLFHSVWGLTGASRSPGVQFCPIKRGSMEKGKGTDMSGFKFCFYLFSESQFLHLSNGRNRPHSANLFRCCPRRIREELPLRPELARHTVPLQRIAFREQGIILCSIGRAGEQGQLLGGSCPQPHRGSGQTGHLHTDALSGA